MLLVLLSLAAAAPLALSAEVRSVREVYEALTPESCVPVLEDVYTSFEGLHPDDVDMEDVATHGADTIQQAFDARLLLQGKLRTWVSEDALDDACLRSVRRADIATRYLIDALYTELPAEARPDPWLVNPAVDFPTPGEGLRTGDVLVSRGAALSSAGIAHMGRIDSQFSHNVLVNVHPEKGAIRTVESYLERGVITQDFTDFLHHDVGRVVVLRWHDPDEARMAAERAWDRVKHGGRIGYDEDFDYDDHSTLFCSEVPRWAFGELIDRPADVPRNLTVFEREKNASLFDAMGIETPITSAPADILFDPRFTIVAEWRDPQVLEPMRRHDAVVESLFTWMEDRGYGIFPQKSDRFTVSFGLTLRRTPLLGLALKKKLHPKNDKQFLVASLALQTAATQLLEDFEARLPIDRFVPYSEMREILEALRKEDLARWKEDPKQARWHVRMHPDLL